jgi:phage FluMu gp28-like protein
MKKKLQSAVRARPASPSIPDPDRTLAPNPPAPPDVRQYFLPYQIDAIMDDARLVLWEKSIRIGATYAYAFRAVRRRMLGLGNYLHTSVNERIAKSFADDCKKFCKIYDIAASDIYEFSFWNGLTERQESAFEIRFPNGTWIKVFSSNPSALRGEGGEVGIDEITSHRDPKEMLKAAGGRAMWGYPVLIWSSHRGEDSEFNRMIRAEKALGDKSRWKVRSTDLYQALDQGLLAKINEVRKAESDAAGQVFKPQTREEFIADTIAMVGGQEAFEEECLLQPRKGGESAIKWNLIAAALEEYQIARIHLSKQDSGIDSIMLALSALGRNVELDLGYDVARRGDLASLWINEKTGPKYRLRALLTMQDLKFGQQRAHVETIMQAFPTAIGAGDATGMGMQVCEELADRFGKARFVGLNFSAQKPDLGTKLVRVYEDNRQILPSGREYEEIQYDLAGIRSEPLPSGRPRFYESPNPINKASHCDIAWSNALAISAGEDQANWGIS